MEGPSRTSLAVAAHRAAESQRADPLFVDPWANALAGDDGVRIAAQLAAASALPHDPTSPTMFAVRTRFYDDAALGAVERTGARQVVALGAGMDTRAFRLDWPPTTRLFELDRPATFRHKEGHLVVAIAACDRRTVEADLSGDWTNPLVGAGFDPTAPTVWVAEGVLYYLDDGAVGALLSTAARSCGPGSVLVTDVAPTAMRDLPALAGWRALLAGYGEPFRSFTDDGTALLGSGGWDVVTARSIADVSEELGHPLPAAGSLATRRLLVATKS